MADKLVEFLVTLSEDTTFAEAFLDDKIGSMVAFGLSDDDQEMILENDVDGIKQRASADSLSLIVGLLK